MLRVKSIGDEIDKASTGDRLLSADNTSPVIPAARFCLAAVLIVLGKWIHPVSDAHRRRESKMSRRFILAHLSFLPTLISTGL